ncbi:MAG: mechanosensitive ion channel family protein [Candidatus Riflebacteria bacterium]|nr:mechanosensitive ion channel family protein [Candidatus Riflebacteria bacterium]
MKKLLLSVLTVFFIANLCVPAWAASNTGLGAETPRDTVRIFINVMIDVQSGKTDEIQKAINLLDLEKIPEAERSVLAPNIALGLYKVLNSFTFRIDSLPVDAKSKVLVLPIGKSKGIEIAVCRLITGKWQFDYDKTIKNLKSYIDIIDKAAESKTEDTTIDSIFFSPRETMRLFLEAMKAKKNSRINEAVATLDLSMFEKAVRLEIGKERAAMLKAVLDRYKYIELIELPNESQGAPVILLTHSAGRIVLEKVKNPESTIEAWKFSAQTIRDLPALYDAFKDQDVVDGVVVSSEVPLSVSIRDYMRKNFPGLMSKSVILENWQWLGIFCVAFLGLAFGKVLIKLLNNAINLLFKREKVLIDIEAQNKFLTPISVCSVTFFWWVGLTLLGLPPEIRLVLLVSVKVVSAGAAVWAGYRLVDVIGNLLMGKAAKTENKYDDLLAPLITRALKAMVVVFGLVFIADIFAIDIDKILAGLGLGGLAFALAAKDTISNLFGSLTILLDRPFQIGDWVTIGKADGTVESVGVRSTRIRTFYDSVITIPNSELINAQIDNYGARNYRRITSTIGIAYNTPPEKIDSFCEGIREIIRRHPHTRKDYFIINLNAFNESSLGIMIYCFVKTPDWVRELEAKHRLYSDIIKLASRLKVEFAFPTRSVFMQEAQPLKHDNVPLNEEEAMELGRKLAAEITANNGLNK